MLVQCPRCGLLATVLPKGQTAYETCFRKDLCQEALELARDNGQPQPPNWICQDLRQAILDALPSPPSRRRRKSRPSLTIIPTTP
jgi:hypothetical protein